MTESNLRHIQAHPNHERPARSISFNTTRSRDRIAANISLLSSMAADQAMFTDLLITSPSAAAELSEISKRLDRISHEIGGAL